MLDILFKNFGGKKKYTVGEWIAMTSGRFNVVEVDTDLNDDVEVVKANVCFDQALDTLLRRGLSDFDRVLEIRNFDSNITLARKSWADGTSGKIQVF